MSDSLRDQLLKSGLVQKLKPQTKPAPAQAAAKKPAAAAPSSAHTKPAATFRAPPAPPMSAEALHERDLARAYALRARKEREEREQAQREAERAAREKKERKQKLAAWLEGKGLNATDAELPRHFPHGSKIRRIYCTPDQLPRLNGGDLAIVQLAGRYLLVTREVALQAQTISAESLVLLCDPNATPEDDVPADVVW